MNKKLKKFLRNPNDFFLDFFHKKVYGFPCKGDSYSLVNKDDKIINNNFDSSDKLDIKNNSLKNKKSDVVANIDDWVEDLIEYLCLKTALIIYAGKDLYGNHVVFCNVDQAQKVHEYILEYCNEGVYLSCKFKAIQKLNRNKVSYYFNDSDNIYLGSCLILDPWFRGGGQIFSYNKNNYVNRLDDRYLNKTPYSSHPIVLQGDYSKPCFSKLLDIDKNIFSKYDFPVDVVITWVDGFDKDWIAKKNEFIRSEEIKNADNGAERYEQIDEIRYALRSIEYYLKFVRNIYIVTDGQKPWWLDLDNEKIIIVDHKEIIDSEYLPTFNSHVIESYIHKIPGLSENFIYCNDDCFVWRPMTKADFFSPGGISFSRFEDVMNVYGRKSKFLPAWKNAAINSNRILAENHIAYAPSYHQHVPMALKKSVLCEMEIKFEKEYKEFRVNRFRKENDISTVSFLYHYYAINSGKAMYVNSKSLTVNSSNTKSLDSLWEKSSFYENSLDFVCINDGGESRNKEKVKNILENKFFQPISWEIFK